MSDLSNGLAEHDYAIHALQAKRWGVSVRHGGKGQPIEFLIYCPDERRWLIVPVEPRRALQLAEKLLAAGLTEI